MGKPSSQAPEDQLSPSEAQEVKQFVRTFSERLRNARDLTPFLTEPPASTILDKVLLDKEDSLPLVNQDLISKGNLDELRRFWIASSNLAYLSELYVYTKLNVKGVRIYELPHERQYPPTVARLLKRNPIVSKSWKQSDSDSSEQIAESIEQLRSLTSTFQKATSLMRTYFKAHRPERTARYRNNIASVSDYLKVIRVHTCTNEENCAGLPLHTKTIYVNIPVLTLMLARIDGQLKILVIGIIDD